MTPNATRSQRSLTLITVVTVLALGATVASAAGPDGPATQIPGGEPGTEKAEIVARLQAEQEAALARPRGREMGPPQEGWDPGITGGIQPFGLEENPFPERPRLRITNWWQASTIDSGGRLRQAYAGVENGHGVVIVVTRDVMLGTVVDEGELELPAGAGRPAFTEGDAGHLMVEVADGRRWRLMVATGDLVPVN